MIAPTPFNDSKTAGHEVKLVDNIPPCHVSLRQGRVPVGPASGTKPILGSITDLRDLGSSTPMASFFKALSDFRGGRLSCVGWVFPVGLTGTHLEASTTSRYPGIQSGKHPRDVLIARRLGSL